MMNKYTSMTPNEVPDDHTFIITLAEEGCIGAAKWLMADAAICLQHGIPLPEPLGNYIGEALYKSAAVGTAVGLDVRDAFHLQRGRGKNKHTELFRAHLICLQVQAEWLSVHHYSERNHQSGAFGIVADRLGRDTEWIRKIFNKHHARWKIKQQSEAELRTSIHTLQRLLKGDPAI